MMTLRSRPEDASDVTCDKPPFLLYAKLPFLDVD